MTATTVLAVRHGETDWNRTDRVQGWAPVPLTDRGRRDARALGAHLADRGVDRVVSSDLRRARETTALLREGGVEPEPTFDRAWRERGVGILQGLPAATLFEEYPEFAVDSGVLSLRARPEGGESFLDLRDRVHRGADGLRGAGGTVLLVTHGGPLTVLRAAAADTDLLRAVSEPSPDNCAILELRLRPRDADGPGSGIELVRETEPVSGEP
ncbi:MAG: histidine phosphatase family protein [Salinirussus sp.]